MCGYAMEHRYTQFVFNLIIARKMIKLN